MAAVRIVCAYLCYKTGCSQKPHDRYSIEEYYVVYFRIVYELGQRKVKTAAKTPQTRVASWL